MAFSGPVGQWLKCLRLSEKAMVRGCVALIDRSCYCTLWTFYEALEHAVYQELPEEQRDAWRSIWRVTKVGPLPFPPPLDYSAVFDFGVWEDIVAWCDVHPPSEDGDCDFSNFDQEHNGLPRPLGT